MSGNRGIGVKMSRRMMVLGGLAAAVAGIAAVKLAGGPEGVRLRIKQAFAPNPISRATFDQRYSQPLPPVKLPVNIYHLGHSLVGGVLPAMLSQLGGNGYAKQLGFGASLKQHWSGDVDGMDQSNDPDHYREAHQALASGDYSVVVFTEMLELRDAIRWHESPAYLAQWIGLSRKARPDLRIFIYETWHWLDDPTGWLDRIDADRADLWEDGVLRPAMGYPDVGTVYVIPGGTVMAAAVRLIETGQVPNLTSRRELFGLNPDGSDDPIHFNDLGAYLMALTHYAVIFQRSPEGLPHQLNHADGTPAMAFTPEAAAMLQKVVWRVVTSYRQTGVAQAE